MTELTAVIAPGESPFDSIRRTKPDGTEYWSARDLMPLMGYGADWRNFDAAVKRAKLAAGNQGFAVDSLFGAVTENLSALGGRPRSDFHLSRFAAYLVAMNGDPRKSEVASAQAYFAVRTHEAEQGQHSAPAATGPELVAMALIEAQRMLESREATIRELKPKANYFDVYVADEDLIRFRTVAADLGMQESELRDLLIEAGWIYREVSTRWSESQGRKVPVYRYSAYAHKKSYFMPVLHHEAPRFKGEVMHTLKLTPKGAEAVAQLVARRTFALPEAALCS